MGRHFLLLIGFAALVSNLVVESIIIPPRRISTCGYMNRKIYCYGGKTSASQSDSVDNNLFTLNITQFSGLITESINNEWELVVPSETFDTEERRIPNAIILADRKRLLINGGFGDEYIRLYNQTIIYDTTTNNWQTVTPYTEGNHGIRQLYSAAAVNLPGGDVGFYGGSEQLGNADVPYVTSNGKVIKYWTDDNGTFVGFTSMHMYSPVTTSWRSFTPQNNLPVDFFPQAQSATLDPTSGKIYFLGGNFYTLTIDEVVVPFNWAHTFNTNSGSWLNESLSSKTADGSDIPSPRQYHTANLLPNSRDIVVYGGTNGTNDSNSSPLSAYCFTLNLIGNTWTKHSNLDIPSNIIGPRFGHSSVLISTTLFIMFGQGGPDNTLQSSLFALDVADVANISYTTTFSVPPESTSNSTDPSKDNNLNAPHSGLSKGAIGGIVAGAVVAVLAIIAAVICFVRRKRKLNEIEEREKRNKNNAEEVHVDWDIIDEQYREVSNTNWSIPNVPDAANLTSSGKKEPYFQKLFSAPHSNNASIVKPSVDTEKGNSSVKPSIDTERSHPLVKPSIDTEKDHPVIRPDAIQD